MRLHRIKVSSFAGIKNAEVEFGPGLNILYGPNDIGKSTLVAAIRLALLLPHTSTHSEEYVAWKGGDQPMVELTFETETQRIWRVTKHFGRSGSSLLQESRNGVDFEIVERSRKVDAKLREILQWGIPEPGGAGGGKGLPTSFLATALLSPQSDVSALFGETLTGDGVSSGKERIAAALQAVAQDPMFVALLNKTQERRDAAYTDKGAKKTAKGSVFKNAAEKLIEARNEKEKYHKTVTESEGAERKIRDLALEQTRKQDELAIATDALKTLDRLAAEATNKATASEQVFRAQNEVLRIKKIVSEVNSAQHEVEEFLRKTEAAGRELYDARSKHDSAKAALDAAEETARSQASGTAGSETIVRQQLELRLSAVDKAAIHAQQIMNEALATKKLVDVMGSAEFDLQVQLAKTANAQEAMTRATANEKVSIDELQRYDLLERVAEFHEAASQVTKAKTAANNEENLKARLAAALAERAVLAERRAAVVVPTPDALKSMRRLATEHARARGALEVGFVVTVTPNDSMNLKGQKDGSDIGLTTIAQPFVIEATSEVDVTIGNIASVTIRGGRREAQETFQLLEDRWLKDVMPHLQAAGVTYLDGLDTKVAESRDLDGLIKAKDADVGVLKTQIDALAGSADSLRMATDRAEDSRAQLGTLKFDSVAAELAALGPAPISVLKKRRQQLSEVIEAARMVTNQAANDQVLAEERSKSSRSALDVAVAARDIALTALPAGVEETIVAAKSSLAAAIAEKEEVELGIASLESTINANTMRINAAVDGARTIAEKARVTVETAEKELTVARTGQASQEGRLIELRKLSEAENLVVARFMLRAAEDHDAAIPVPDRVTTKDEIADAKDKMTRLSLDLDTIQREIQRAQGALEIVGGAVARERLYDATEAFDIAEHQEREVEAEYEAWKLLLDQMKAAEAEQSSNLGLALAPAIAEKFQALTQRRYDTVRLTAQLGTEGIVADGNVRAMERISVGTREQLSTLYRLSLAEYLQTVIVLDDQLVQSDNMRMDWFRSMLAEKAPSFQIVVFTCRPNDYLMDSSILPEGSAVHADGDGGFTRAVDLGRVLHRK